MNLITDTAIQNALLDATFKAGKVILDIRQKGFSETLKQDGSPVTLADQLAEEILLTTLSRLFPEIPIIAEEEADKGTLPTIGGTFFLVDALDGTKDFIAGGNNFTVNIGLISQSLPVFGIVYAPAIGRLFLGGVNINPWQAIVDCRQSFPEITNRSQLKVRKFQPTAAKALASHSHRDGKTDKWLEKHEFSTVEPLASSLKFCRLAAGEADVYPRFSPCMEWDTAAGHAILEAAGGKLTGIAGEQFLYGKVNQSPPFLNPGFIASGSWGQ
ncbi:MAG: 3'(2'),5'-bisphosphate nucleotidase CysQ [Robiginitomaculum sp.]|nr:3'(2'),5'-bisphosphate nucleotidase CysQ [Robiginitomaculum sp.]